MPAGIGTRHGQTPHIFCAEGVHSQDGCQRGVNPSGEPQTDLAETGLLDVIPHTEHQCLIQIFLPDSWRKGDR